MVHEEFQKDLKIKLIDRLFIVLHVFAVSDLVLHVLDFFLSGVEPHASHHVGDRTQWYLAIQLSCFGCVFVL